MTNRKAKSRTLDLHKETIRQLATDELRVVAGGAPPLTRHTQCDTT